MISFDSISTAWWAWAWANFWQFGLLVAGVWVIDRCIRGWAWPQVRYALWLVIVAKLVTPPHLWSPLSLTAKWTDASATPVIVEAVAYTVDQSIGGNGMQQAINAATSATRATSGAIGAPTGASSVWMLAVMVVWLVGTIGLSTAFVLRMRQLSRSFENDAADNPTPNWLQRMAAECAREIGVRRLPQILISRELNSPAAFGLTNPVVIVPASWLADAPRSDLRHALLHEMAHIRRGDLYMQAALTAVQLLWWFHPAAYFAARRVAELREVCCDATVASVLRERTPEYRKTLVRVAQRFVGIPHAATPDLIGLFERPGDLVTRLRALRSTPWKHGWLRGWTAVVIAGGLAATILPMSTPQPTPCRPHETGVVLAAAK